VVGSFQHWNSLESHYMKHIAQKIKNIVLYPFPDMILQHYRKNLLNRAAYRFHFHSQSKIKYFNSLLFQKVAKEKPDIVWIFKGLDILPETLEKIKRLGIKLVNYNADHPFIRTFRSSGGKEIENCIPLYDLVFCYSRNLMDDIKARYTPNIKTYFLPFGYGLTETERMAIFYKANVESEIQRLCFIGNPDNEFRYKTLKQIISRKIPIDIYGKGWHKYFSKKHENLKVQEGIYDQDYWSALPRYRAQLNIFRPHNESSHNMRTFEIPAVGGIQLAPDSIEHREFFIENKEIFLYNSIESLIEKTEVLLGFSDQDSRVYREAAFLKCTHEDYSYKRRAEEVVTVFSEMI